MSNQGKAGKKTTTRKPIVNKVRSKSDGNLPQKDRRLSDTIDNNSNGAAVDIGIDKK